MEKSEEYCTVTMTGRPPVRFRPADWPLVAETTYTWYDGEAHHKSFRQESARIRVRRHADGRALVYGGYDYHTTWGDERSVHLRDGYLLSADDSVTRAIRVLTKRLARRLALEGRGTRIVERLAR